MVMFSDSLEKFGGMVEVGQVYLISKGTASQAKKARRQAQSALSRHAPAFETLRARVATPADARLGVWWHGACAQEYTNFTAEYEIKLDKTSTVEHCPGDPMENMRPQYHFRQIGTLAGCAQRELVDVVGVVASVQPVQALTRKDGSAMEKRAVYVRDDSGHTIEVTMWAPFASREGATLEQARALGLLRRPPRLAAAC